MISSGGGWVVGEDARRYWIEAKEEIFALIVILSKP
jgi:hypothetical protein